MTDTIDPNRGIIGGTVREHIRQLEEKLATSEAALAAEKERADAANGRSISRGKLLTRVRDILVNVRDELEDEGDRVYLGSTNDTEAFREAVEALENFNWHLVLAEKDDEDPYALCRIANARADTAEAALATSEAALWRIMPNTHTVSCELNSFAAPDPFEGPGETYADAYERERAAREKAEAALRGARAELYLDFCLHAGTSRPTEQQLARFNERTWVRALNAGIGDKIASAEFGYAEVQPDTRGRAALKPRATP